MRLSSHLTFWVRSDHTAVEQLILAQGRLILDYTTVKLHAGYKHSNLLHKMSIINKMELKIVNPGCVL
jgi:hypothetical protein